MPYIKQEDREEYSGALTDLIGVLVDNDFHPGHVNYVFTRILINWFKHNPCYKTVCSIMGTCSAVAVEFYRHVAAPYEEEKIKQNGDL